VRPSCLPPEVCSSAALDLQIGMNRMEEEGFSLPELVETIERQFYKRALSLSGGNQSRAAKMLGVPRSSLQEKIRKYFPDIPMDEGK